MLQWVDNAGLVGLAAIDQISPFPCNNANVRIRQELPNERREAALDISLDQSSWLPSIVRVGGRDRPVSPSPMRHFGKTQSGIGFGKTQPVIRIPTRAAPTVPQYVPN